jgi:hypothetical protein
MNCYNKLNKVSNLFITLDKISNIIKQQKLMSYGFGNDLQNLLMKNFEQENII